MTERIVCLSLLLLLWTTSTVVVVVQGEETTTSTTTTTTTTTTSSSSSRIAKSWKLYHSWNNGKEYTHRSNIILSIYDTNNTADLSITHMISPNNSEEEGDEEATLDPQWVQDWVQHHPNGLYQLKLVEDKEEEEDNDDDDDEEEKNTIVTSVPACSLLRSNFREEIILRLGHYASAISFSYVPLVSPLAPKTCIGEDVHRTTGDDEIQKDDPTSTKQQQQLMDEAKKQQQQLLIEQWKYKKFSNTWDTQRLSFETFDAGMTLRPIFPPTGPPPFVQFLPRLNAEGRLVKALPGQENAKPGENGGNGGAGGEKEPPQGFLRKYWYIIVPLMIMNLMGAPAPPDEQEGGGGGGAAAAGGGGASGGGQQGGGGVGGRPRRGKRG